MTSLIVDASVAAKWFVQEPDSETARAIGSAGYDLIAPELVLAEVANVLWKKVLQKSMTPEAAAVVMQGLPHYFDRLVPSALLGPRALELACALKHPVYDCFYLALAEREAIPIVSADARLLAAAKRSETIEARALV